MIIDDLITDRTSADVSRWQTLFNKGWNAMTAAEQTEWLAGMKGAYIPAIDMNRVGEAVKKVAGQLGATGYGVTTAPKTDWTYSDIPTPAQLTDYLAQVAAVRAGIATVLDSYNAEMQYDLPSVPDDMLGLTYQEANDIEQILTAVYDQLKYMGDRFYWYFSGDLYAGEV